MTTGKPSLNFLTSLLVACCLTAFSAPSQAGLEDKLEKSLGNQVSREIEQQMGVVRDPILTAWVKRVGDKLVSVSSRQDVDYTFKILDSEDINAIAVPGGHIYVTKGLLRFIESEDELAAVVGHEIGHIVAKHSNKQIKTQILASLALSSIKSRRYSTAVGVARLGGVFAMLKFSRDDEREADLLGLEEMMALGYDSDRMLDFFKRLDDKQKKKPSKFETYLMTHPTFKDRMARLRDRPEMKASAEKSARTARNMEDRSLLNQARRRYEEALSLDPGYSPALSGMSRVVSRNSSVDPRIFEPFTVGQRKATPVDLTAKVEAVNARADLLEKKEKALLKQIKSAASSLNAVGSFINPYDPMSARAFDMAARALTDVDHAAGGLRILIDNCRLAGVQFSALNAHLVSLDTAAQDVGRLSDGFSKAAPGSFDAMSAALTQSIDLAKQSADTCSAVHFAIRQLQGSLLAPNPAGLTLSGAVEMQLKSADDSALKQIKGVRRSIGSAERARSTALQTTIDLYAFESKSIDKDEMANMVAGYTGSQASDIRIDKETSFGAEAARLAGGGVQSGAEGVKAAEPPMDYDSVNILLQIMIHDLERETLASGAQLPFALSAGKQ